MMKMTEISHLTNLIIKIFITISVLSITACFESTPPATRATTPLKYVGIGNIENGKKIYDLECLTCHQLALGKNKKAPQLLGIYGSPASSLADYKNYSDAMKKSQWIWDDTHLHSFLENPKATLAGNKMYYDGLLDKVQREDLIAYLATLPTK